MLVYGPNENGFLKVRATTGNPPAGPNASSRAPGRMTGLQGWRMVEDTDRIFVLRRDGIHACEKVAFTKALVASTEAFGTKQQKEERTKERKQRGLEVRAFFYQ